MRLLYKDSNILFIRFDKSEEVLTKLLELIKKQSIKSASLNAIGAVTDVAISFYDISTKKYLTKEFKDEYELVSLTGNISTFESSQIIHAHGSIADKNYKTYSGHITKIVVTGTCELTLFKMNKKLFREYDYQTGLKLLK